MRGRPTPAWRVLAMPVALLLLLSQMARAGDSATDLAELGRRIFEDGLLPDGSPLRGETPQGVVFEGRFGACAICHRLSGMGAIEGSLEDTILVPPIAAGLLFTPALSHGTYYDLAHRWVPNAAWARAVTRSAYDEQALARALRQGVDPDGSPLIAPMPRYALDDAAMSALTAYLRVLGSTPSPGVEAETLHVATIVTPDVPPEQAETFLGVVRTWVASAPVLSKRWKLHAWRLSGPPEQWEQELDARYAAEPVFALISGIGSDEWSPVQRFCEASHVPCVLPSIEVAPTEGTPHFSVYFSHGVTLEARVLARFLSGLPAESSSTGKIVQVYADGSGSRAADTLDAQLGPAAATTRRRFLLTAPTAALDGIEPDDVIVLWLRPAELDLLAEMKPRGPGAGQVYVSTLLAAPEDVSLPPAWKARVRYVSLFDDLGVQGEIARLRLAQWLDRAGLAHAGDLRLQADAYAACYLFSTALAQIEKQRTRRPAVPLTREHLLETLEVVLNKYSDGSDLVEPGSHVAYYGRMSLGPGQRFAVRGGAILRYASPDSSKLIRASERIVP